MGENGVRCVMTGLNKTSNRKNYFRGLGRPCFPHAGPPESMLLLTGS